MQEITELGAVVMRRGPVVVGEQAVNDRAVVFITTPAEAPRLPHLRTVFFTTSGLQGSATTQLLCIDLTPHVGVVQCVTSNCAALSAMR